jgi:hypothetical protein
LDLRQAALSRLQLSKPSAPLDCRGADLSDSTLDDVNLTAANLSGASFLRAQLQSVIFADADLTGCDFSGALLIDAVFDGAKVTDANFSGVRAENITLVTESSGSRARITGYSALGFLRYQGAATADLSDYHVYQHHRRFEIVEKILSRLSEQTLHQRRGLEQRGPASKDIPFARILVSKLESLGWLLSARDGQELLEVTESGRKAFSKFSSAKHLPPEVAEFLQANP